MIRRTLSRGTPGTRARARAQREKRERKRERRRQNEEGELRVAATVGCQPRCSRLRRVHTHTQLATRRLSVGTSHRLVHFYSPPLHFFSCVRSPLATRVRSPPFPVLRLGISCPSGPSLPAHGGRHPKNRAVRGAAG